MGKTKTEAVAEAPAVEAVPEVKAVRLGGQPEYNGPGFDRVAHKESGVAYLQELAAAMKPIVEAADDKTDHGGAKNSAHHAYNHLLFTISEMKEY